MSRYEELKTPLDYFNTKTEWDASAEGIWNVTDPTYHLDAFRFDNRIVGHVKDVQELFNNDLLGWLLHLRSKTYFDRGSELSFIAAYLKMISLRARNEMHGDQTVQ